MSMFFQKSAIETIVKQAKSLRKLAGFKKTHSDRVKAEIDEIQKKIVEMNAKRASLILELEAYNASAEALEAIVKGAKSVKEVIA